MIERNESQLKRRIFTELQIDILKKKLKNKPLNSNEKTYYYKFIKPKVKAMLSFLNIDEFNIKGREYIIESRLDEIKSILKKLSLKHKNQKMMVSGSFLFNEKYHDIDVFVFSKYKKEDYFKGKLHVSFLPESALDSLFFSSLSQISISNFVFEAKKEFVIDVKDLLQQFEILINQLFGKEDCKTALRDFLLNAEFIAKGVVLNPKQLYDLQNFYLSRKNPEIFSIEFINVLALRYNKSFLSRLLKKRIDDYENLSKQYKHSKSFELYINTYKQAIKVAS